MNEDLKKSLENFQANSNLNRFKNSLKTKK